MPKFILNLLFFFSVSLFSLKLIAQVPAAPQKAAPVNPATKPAPKAQTPAAAVKSNGRGGSYDDEDDSGIKKVRKRKQRAKRVEEEELRQWQYNTYKKKF